MAKLQIRKVGDEVLRKVCRPVEEITPRILTLLDDMTETMRAFGPDSLVGYMVSIMSGSTETTFYVLAVYFGAVGVRATRHTVPCCLCADLTGMLMAGWLARAFFG